ncbi:hypothetical protein [Colwellia sp. Arc7-D]|uniref:hypothetical protein n=1 Tax=Colwellia sp. Arc7-D TaxID=2161872 RepID=UPI000D37285B|nr:hypothetical protein [Colwellia sp. Arc7-D]AWB58199.1 hypothetical protein DBO93_11890 [Colwellia sp. Arc7-D]
MSQQYLDSTISLYAKIELQLKYFANRGNAIQNTLLVIGVLTSGGLWLLVAQVLPQVLMWLGAIFSTLTTGLTLYMYSSGVNKKRQKAIELHSEVSDLLGKIRGNPKLTDNEFWPIYKDLEHKIDTLMFGLE